MRSLPFCSLRWRRERVNLELTDYRPSGLCQNRAIPCRLPQEYQTTTFQPGLCGGGSDGGSRLQAWKSLFDWAGLLSVARLSVRVCLKWRESVSPKCRERPFISQLSQRRKSCLEVQGCRDGHRHSFLSKAQKEDSLMSQDLTALPKEHSTASANVIPTYILRKANVL